MNQGLQLGNAAFHATGIHGVGGVQACSTFGERVLDGINAIGERCWQHGIAARTYGVGHKPLVRTQCGDVGRVGVAACVNNGLVATAAQSKLGACECSNVG